MLEYDWAGDNVYLHTNTGNIWVCGRKFVACKVVVANTAQDSQDLRSGHVIGFALDPHKGYTFKPSE